MCCYTKKGSRTRKVKAARPVLAWKTFDKIGNSLHSLWHGTGARWTVGKSRRDSVTFSDGGRSSTGFYAFRDRESAKNKYTDLGRVTVQVALFGTVVAHRADQYGNTDYAGYQAEYCKILDTPENREAIRAR